MERSTGCFAPDYFGTVTEEHSAWHETPREIKEGLRRGKRKAILLAWVRREMERRLTKRQQQYMDLHYFHGWSCRVIGERLGVPKSSVSRTVQRALHRLIEAAQHLDDQDPLDRAVMRLTGREAGPTEDRSSRHAAAKGYHGEAASARVSG